jgi:malate/lactate dehydrogenase
MIEAAMGGAPYTLPAGCYVNSEELGYKNVMMAMPTTIDADGVHYVAPEGTAEEMAALQSSVEHLGKMRDEISLSVSFLLLRTGPRRILTCNIPYLYIILLFQSKGKKSFD